MFSHFLSNPGSSGVDDNLHYIKKVKSCFLDIQVSVWFSVWLFGYINIGTIRVFKGFGPVSVTGNSVPVRFFGSGFFLPSATVCVMASHVEVMAWAREAHVTAFFVQIWHVKLLMCFFFFFEKDFFFLSKKDNVCSFLLSRKMKYNKDLDPYQTTGDIIPY